MGDGKKIFVMANQADVTRVVKDHRQAHGSLNWRNGCEGRNPLAAR
jgi:hypothetical protein